MSNKPPYDIKDPVAIKAYAKRLENKTLRQLFGNDLQNSYSGKGKLGQLLEELYFNYKPNSNSEPDFLEAGLELKTTPLKKISKGLVSKERLVFNIINFEEEYKLSFENSSFWKKNKLLLLIFYLHEKEKLDIDYVFKIVRLWRFPLTDLKIIIDDWKTIVAKIKAGKAHEISEGDTLYLGACTKGSTAEKSKRKQPFSDILAPQRAFSLKSKYLNFIIERSFKGDFELPAVNEAYTKVLQSQNDFTKSGYDDLVIPSDSHEAVIKDVSDYREGQTFEDLIVEKFEKYYGWSEKEIVDSFNLNVNLKAKNKNYVLARAILGVTKQKIEEFEKAEIELKTIKLAENGVLKESMSFAQIKFLEIVNEEWEESYLYTTLTKRFFFVIFKKDKHQVSRLYKVKFWTMPYSDLIVAEDFWNDTKKKIKKGVYNQFWKLKDHKIFHVRPKGVNSKDLMETPQGTMEKKKSYWLNSRYILNQITN
ncbi:DNA mismatch repair protein [Maribacter polysiphoniae]|uniref:DNA mismatch repair protein n=1 Tax=Maribacter polysiphoniae TaxID=429344 RepID=A0A316EB12_9FLAO|nr:MutH/Sau3AI family endonuclease [Maribacter polysiphoniae]MBD1262798.1 DNA mismatch repair protein [Maribacter polysiphoniae]PWK20110.1 DNA mismatch repair protein MutH [Maribacter polysiphoniae]